MPMPVDRPLSGDVLVLHLAEERTRAFEGETQQRHGRRSRTLLKEGTLRVVLIILGPGDEISEHSSEGPITVQPLDGSIRFTVAGRHYEIGPGDLLSVGAGVEHTVSSVQGATFLLTVSHPG
jgi:quercetin dioxygenase-like cupin family protein